MNKLVAEEHLLVFYNHDELTNYSCCNFPGSFLQFSFITNKTGFVAAPICGTNKSAQDGMFFLI